MEDVLPKPPIQHVGTVHRSDILEIDGLRFTQVSLVTTLKDPMALLAIPMKIPKFWHVPET